MKYIFESDEIKNCWKCNFGLVFEYDTEILCNLSKQWIKDGRKPTNCPLVEWR